MLPFETERGGVQKAAKLDRRPGLQEYARLLTGLNTCAGGGNVEQADEADNFLRNVRIAWRSATDVTHACSCFGGGTLNPYLYIVEADR